MSADRKTYRKLKYVIATNENLPTRCQSLKTSTPICRSGCRDFEMGQHSMSATMVGRQKKKLGFRWSKKVKITLETISFWQNISISIFKFSPFLSIKSYQFFKMYYCIDKETEKTHIQQSRRKEKLRKVGLCFTTLYFIKPFQLIINHLFLKLIRSTILVC